MASSIASSSGSLPAWGEWIEISHPILSTAWVTCLSPHGESGLKCFIRPPEGGQLWSLPAWGEWIEIIVAVAERLGDTGLSPHGESGLK